LPASTSFRFTLLPGFRLKVLNETHADVTEAGWRLTAPETRESLR
jgi:hypothetical protein